MKRQMILRLSAVGLIAGMIFIQAFADDAPDPTESLTFSGMGLAAIGDLADNAVERVREFAERNTGVPVRIREVADFSASSLSEIALELASERPEEDAAFVLLYAEPNDFSEHAIYYYDLRTAIVNVTRLRTDDEERFLRRVERLTMRSLGLLMDVRPVPNPQSAMWPYQTLEELDQMGRNFDPPSLRDFQSNATRLGIELIEDSPFFMIR